MKKNFLLSLILILMFSCKARHGKEVTMLPETVVVQDSTTLHPPEQTGQLYRLVVTFISIGEGTDQEAGPMLENYVSVFNDENSILASYDRIPWGREGEIDNCFMLNNFSSVQQKSFIDGVNELFKENKLVQITENRRIVTIK